MIKEKRENKNKNIYDQNSIRLCIELIFEQSRHSMYLQKHLINLISLINCITFENLDKLILHLTIMIKLTPNNLYSHLINI